MKVVSAWPEYGNSRMVAVTEDGEVFTLFYDRDVTSEWVPFAGPIRRQPFPRNSPASSRAGS